MAEIEKIMEKSFDELTMGEAIVIYMVDKQEGIKRIDYLTKKAAKKPMGL
jgi:hypothetical protein